MALIDMIIIEPAGRACRRPTLQDDDTRPQAALTSRKAMNNNYCLQADDIRLLVLGEESRAAGVRYLGSLL